MGLGDYTTALEYLVLSKNYDTAFDVACQHGQMQLFAEILGDQAQASDYNKIAAYYEKERNLLLAGKFFALAGQHTKVCQLLQTSARVHLTLVDVVGLQTFHQSGSERSG